MLSELVLERDKRQAKKRRDSVMLKIRGTAGDRSSISVLVTVVKTAQEERSFSSDVIH